MTRIIGGLRHSQTSQYPKRDFMKKETKNKKEIPFQYDLKYWQKMLRQNSSTAEILSRIRWDFVSKVKPKTVLDYGCGPGWFAAFAPNGINVDTYDIAPWPQTGVKDKHYDLVTMWDVLEHIPDLKVVKSVFNSAKAVAIATPMFPKHKDFATWSHNKPGQHLKLFTKRGFLENRRINDEILDFVL